MIYENKSYNTRSGSKRLKENGAPEITLEEAEKILTFLNKLGDLVLAKHIPYYKKYLNSKEHFSYYKYRETAS